MSQMPGPRAGQNLQMPHPRDWQGGQMPRSSPGGSWAQVELTDALPLKRDMHENAPAKKNEGIITKFLAVRRWLCQSLPSY